VGVPAGPTRKTALDRIFPSLEPETQNPEIFKPLESNMIAEPDDEYLKLLKAEVKILLILDS
jgi:hypothetical protein